MRAPAGPTKKCPDCGLIRDRYKDFKPRYGHCDDHAKADAHCNACQTQRNRSTRQPRCIMCDSKRIKVRTIATRAAKEAAASSPEAVTAPVAPPLPSDTEVAAAIQLKHTLTAYRARSVKLANAEKAVAEAKANDQPELLVKAQALLAVAQKRADRCEAHARTLAGLLITASTTQAQFIAGRLEAALDTARVAAGGSLANDAIERIREQVSSRLRKLIYKRVKHDRVLGADYDQAKENTASMIDKGIFLGARDWDPFHPTQASLSTLCHSKVRRELQVRTRVDRAIGAVQDLETGDWENKTSSYEAISGSVESGERGFEPVACGTSKTRQHAAGRVHEQDYVAAVAADVGEALLEISDEDRQILELLHVHSLSIKSVAARFGLSAKALNERVRAAEQALSQKLVCYENIYDGGDE